MHVYVSGHPQSTRQGFNFLARDRVHLVSSRRHALRNAASAIAQSSAGSWPTLERWTARLLWATITVVLFFDVLFTFGAPGLASLIGS